MKNLSPTDLKAILHSKRANSITQAAMRMLAQAGVLVGFCGRGSNDD